MAEKYPDSVCQDVFQSVIAEGNFGQAYKGTKVVNKDAHDHGLTKIGPQIYTYKHLKGQRSFRGIQKQLDGKVLTELAVRIFEINERDKKSFNWYISEIEKMSKLHHPNIVRFINCDKVCDEAVDEFCINKNLWWFYIAMELCHEMTLADLHVLSLRRDQKQNLFLQICDGVEYLHENKIAHMNLNPENILFSLDGKKAVISYLHLIEGMREFKTFVTSGSQSQVAMQRWCWLSAEMYRQNMTEAKNSCKNTELDYYKADIFSLGLIGHHVFYGCHPFRNIECPKLPAYSEININEHNSPTVGAQEPSSLEPDVVDLFEKMLSHHPTNRPTIDDVLQHWMFWTSTKKLNFLVDMYNHYFGNEKFMKRVKANGIEEQKLAYEELPKTFDANPAALDLGTSQILLKSPESESNTPSHFSSNSEKGAKEGKEKILTRMRKFMSDRWMDKIEMTPHYRNSDKEEYNNSLIDLVRYIWDKLVHTLGQSQDQAVQMWIALFPDLWPYLYETLKPFFTEQDKTEYTCTNTHTGDIGVKEVLGKTFVDKDINAKFPRKIKEEPKVTETTDHKGLSNVDGKQQPLRQPVVQDPWYSSCSDNKADNKASSDTTVKENVHKLKDLRIREETASVSKLRTNHGGECTQQHSLQTVESHYSPHQLTFNAEGGGYFGFPPLPQNSQSNLTWKILSKKTSALSEGDDLTQIGHEVYIDIHHPLRKGYHVYKGIRNLLNGKFLTDLAVKIFHIDETDDKLFKWFVNEAMKMSQFDHPNIVRFIDCNKIIDEKLVSGYYIAMELCHQMNLADINAASLRRDQKQNLFLQICDGVEYLHKNKVAHMDLKPANILFSHKTDKAVVSDFGMSKHVDKVVRDGKTYIKKSSSRYGGTRGWISKEMIQRITSMEQQDTEPDYFKADIFSLGLIGHHIFYGCHPFRSNRFPNITSYWEVNINYAKSPVIGPQKPESAVPDVVDLFEKMLSHDPMSRPTSEEVLQHWMFWSPTKKLAFPVDMSNHYFSKPTKTGKMTEEQRLAYEELPDTSDANTLASNFCDGQNQLFLETGKEKILWKMREIMGDRWMDKIKENTTNRIKDRYRYKNSLADLVRYIRNQVVHRRQNEADDQMWVTLFPKLWPYLLAILGPAFTEEDKTEYKRRNTHTGDIGVKPLLEIEDIKTEFPRKVKEKADEKEYNTHTGDIGVEPLLEIEDIKTEFARKIKEKAEITQTIDPTGGDIQIPDCSLNFPSNAVKKEEEVTVSLDNNPENYPPNRIAVAPILCFKPSMKFDRPVTVRMQTWFSALKGKTILGILSHKKGGSDWKDDGEVILDSTNVVQFTVTHFCKYSVTVDPQYGILGRYTLFNDIYLQRDMAIVHSCCYLDKRSEAVFRDILRGKSCAAFSTKTLRICGKVNQKISLKLEISKPECESQQKEFQIEEVVEFQNHHSQFKPDLDLVLEDYNGFVEGSFFANVVLQRPTPSSEDSVVLKRKWPVNLDPPGLPNQNIIAGVMVDHGSHYTPTQTDTTSTINARQATGGD